MKSSLTHVLKQLFILSLLTSLCGCSTMANVLNPFYEAPAANAYLGEANDHALRGGMEKEDRARAALDGTAKYQKAHLPQPVNPVVQPSVIRLMWVPDHLNRNGDLVPAHYYYLKVLKDRWAVSDAFELEAQLGDSNNGTSALPYVWEGDKRGR